RVRIVAGQHAAGGAGGRARVALLTLRTLRAGLAFRARWSRAALEGFFGGGVDFRQADGFFFQLLGADRFFAELGRGKSGSTGDDQEHSDRRHHVGVREPPAKRLHLLLLMLGGSGLDTATLP